MPLTTAPPQAAALMLSARRTRFLRSLAAGGMPALWAMIDALSRRSPSLTAEYSGFIKNRTLSKYSHWVCVISTTCLLTPFIKMFSPFTLFILVFYAIFGIALFNYSPQTQRRIYNLYSWLFSTKKWKTVWKRCKTPPKKPYFNGFLGVENFIILKKNIQKVVQTLHFVAKSR